METLIGIVEVLSTKAVCFPALKNPDLIKQLASIITQEEEEISLIATCSITLANIETEHSGGILTGGRAVPDHQLTFVDKELLSSLISHLTFNKLDPDTASILTLLNEITKKLNPEEHADLIEVSLDHYCFSHTQVLLRNSAKLGNVLKDANWEGQEDLIRQFGSHLQENFEEYLEYIKTETASESEKSEKPEDLRKPQKDDLTTAIELIKELLAALPTA